MLPRARRPEAMPLDPKRAAAAEVEIAQLRELDLKALQARWHSLRGRPAPRHLPKHLLLRLLAYQLQAAVHGDLDPATRRYLDQIARADASGTDEPVQLPVPNARAGPARHRPGAGVGRRGLPRHGAGGRLRLERHHLPQPVPGRPRDHRHPLERSPLLRGCATYTARHRARYNNNNRA